MKYVFIIKNAWGGHGTKTAVRIVDVPKAWAADEEAAAWWYMNRVDYSAQLLLTIKGSDFKGMIITETGGVGETGYPLNEINHHQDINLED